MTRTMKVWYELEDLLPQFRFVETGRNVPNLTTVAVMSAVAKAESDAISTRVKSAYRLLKDKHGQDLRWGNPNVGNMSKIATEAKKEKMHAYWMDILIADAALYRNMGWNQKTRLAHLNRMGFRSRRGKELTRQSQSRPMLDWIQVVSKLWGMNYGQVEHQPRRIDFEGSTGIFEETKECTQDNDRTGCRLEGYIKVSNDSIHRAEPTI